MQLQYEHETCSKRQLIPSIFRGYHNLKIVVWTKVAPFLKSAHIYVHSAFHENVKENTILQRNAWHFSAKTRVRPSSIFSCHQLSTWNFPNNFAIRLSNCCGAQLLFEDKWESTFPRGTLVLYRVGPLTIVIQAAGRERGVILRCGLLQKFF